MSKFLRDQHLTEVLRQKKYERTVGKLKDSARAGVEVLSVQANHTPRAGSVSYAARKRHLEIYLANKA